MTIGNRPPTVRADGRGPNDLRPVSFTLGVQKWAEGSCRIKVGDTEVLCAATIVDRVPPHLRGKGTGWVTAEYSMLPRATAERTDRESVKGRIGGRTHEIQRLIGRSLRGVVDLAKLGERTITVDCDVLQADGGTRTASITGGYVALAAALITFGMERHLVAKVAAVSVGLVNGLPYLDLDYSEDSRADVDFNVVATDGGAYVELQGTAEGKPVRPGRRRTRCSTWRDSGLAQPVRGPGGDPRHRPAVTRRRPVLVVATRSPHKLRELRELLRARTGRPRVARRDRRQRASRSRMARPSRPTPAIKARYGLRADRPADAGRRFRARGRCARRRSRGPHAAVRRRERDRRGQQPQAARGAGGPAAGTPRSALRLRPGVASPTGWAPAAVAAVMTRARDVPRSDRRRGPRQRRLRLRPDLRAGLGATRRPDPRASGPPAEKHAISHRARAAGRMAPSPGGPRVLSGARPGRQGPGGLGSGVASVSGSPVPWSAWGSARLSAACRAPGRAVVAIAWMAFTSGACDEP